MSAIKAWIFSVAVSSLVAGVVYMLTPKGSLQKIVRVAIFTFIISSSVSPLITGSIDLDFQLPELEYSDAKENKLIDKITESMETVAVKSIERILKSMKITDPIVKIITDKNPDNSISITETVITVRPEDISKSQEIKLRIKNELGYDVRVTT